MGRNKAWLSLQGKSIIEAQIEELSKVLDPVIVVSNEPELYAGMGVKVVGDDFPGSGPLAGIQAGLKAAPGEVIFVAPCDMPFIGAEIGTQMLKHLDDADGLVLEVGGKLEPLCALYTKRCLPVIEEFPAGQKIESD